MAEKKKFDKVFPLLKKEDIEVRVVSINDKETELLLHKNARVDMEMLDTYVGPMNWQRHHVEIKGAMHCIISIYDEDKKVWIEKDDAGTPGSLEPAKTEASDSFKRAATNWGIGRELYTAPRIVIPTEALSVARSASGVLYCTTNFDVRSYLVENNKIVALAIGNKDTRKLLFVYDCRTNKETVKEEKEAKKEKPRAKQAVKEESVVTVAPEEAHESTASESAGPVQADSMITAPENGQCTLIIPEQPKVAPSSPTPASTVDEAMNVKVDVGEAAREGKTLGDIYQGRPQRLFWVFNKTESEIVKNAVLLIVKNDESLTNLFISRGINV